MPLPLLATSNDNYDNQVTSHSKFQTKTLNKNRRLRGVHSALCIYVTLNSYLVNARVHHDQ